MKRKTNARFAKVVALLALAIALFGLAASVVEAELSASGNLFITFNGGIVPNALPRNERGPITVWMSGTVRILSGEQPPSLREIKLSLNREGKLDTRGLPTCRKSRIIFASSEEALKACRPALVGNGRYKARTTFPEQARTPASGKILAFNSSINGKPVILAHVYGVSPTVSTDIIVFHIRHPSGTFGTELSGVMPPGLTRWGYLKQISLSLHRTYAYRGRTHSYLSAPCPAPAGLTQASFPFLYTSLSFEDGRVLSANLTRTCKVKGA